MRYVLMGSLLCVTQFCLSQKPSLDTATFFNWPVISKNPNPAISNNGKYALYTIGGNTPHGHQILVITSLDTDWHISLMNVSNAQFTEDSRSVIYIQGADSLS